MSGGGELSAVDRLALNLSRSYYALARALRLNRLADLLASGACPTAEAPVWLLGQRYSCAPGADDAQQEEALARMLHHFQSIPWMSYRTGFAGIPAGSVDLHSDAGWGCTLRSAQMILAQGLLRHALGAGWRWPGAARQQARGGEPAAAGAPGEAPPRLARLLELFWDTPAARAPFSLHNLCGAGNACGVVPGRWLGPWVACRALEAAAAAARLRGTELGLSVAVLAESGGGAPLLVVPRYQAVFAAAPPGSGTAASAQQQQQPGQQLPQEGQQAGCTREPPAPAPSVELVPTPSGLLSVEPPPLSASLAQLGDGGGGGGRGLVLLVPLVLGLGKLNPRYVPQLEAALAMPQSIGIVGGRPSSSLYFVGFQRQPAAAAAPPPPGGGDNGGGAPGGGGGSAAERAAGGADGSGANDGGGGGGGGADGSGANGGGGGGGGGTSVLYLDPHQVQEAAGCPADWRSFWCESPRCMPLAAIDPSLALGFYCSGADEFRDLCARLAELEARSGGAPLVCVAADEPPAQAAPHETTWEPDDLSSEEEEEEAGREAAERAAGGSAAQQQREHEEEAVVVAPEAAAEAASAQEEPVVLAAEAVAEAAAAMPSPPAMLASAVPPAPAVSAAAVAAAARRAGSAGLASPRLAGERPQQQAHSAPASPPAQQQAHAQPDVQQTQHGAPPPPSPRQASRGWELL